MAAPIDYSHTFTGPGEIEIQARGKYVRVLDAPSGSVGVKLDSDSEVLRDPGQEVPRLEGFQRVRLSSQVAQTVRVSVSDVPQADGRQNVGLTVSATVAGATAITPLAVVTVPAGNKAKIADANADRIELRIGIASDQPGAVYIGDSTVVAGTGGILEPGMVDYPATTAEVWAYNPGASDVDVTVVDLESP
jgi:hypothetical protein